MQVDETEHFLMTREELENKIATVTGGRAAEEFVFGSITTGASNDIEQATRIARAMITRYGMSDEFGMVAMETVNNQYLGGDTTLACSAETQARIDQKVKEVISAQHEKAAQIIRDNEQKLHELADYLCEHENHHRRRIYGHPERGCAIRTERKALPPGAPRGIALSPDPEQPGARRNCFPASPGFLRHLRNPRKSGSCAKEVYP